MHEMILRETFSPLDGLEDRFGGTAARLEPVGFRCLVNLRCRPDDDGALRAVEHVFGLAPPRKANSWAGATEKAAVWLGPDEWLLIEADGYAPAIERALRDARGDDAWLSITDITDNYTGLVLSGPAARDVLAKGCPLDLHPRAFAPGDCAQTLLAKTRMLLRGLDDTPRFEIWVRNSYARYTAEWLFDAAWEYNSALA